MPNPLINITRLEADLSGILHGTTLNQVKNLYGVFNRAASQLLLDCDPQETIRIFPIANSVYSQVFSYPIPIDLKGNRLLNLAPQAITLGNLRGNNFTQLYNADFNFAAWWSQWTSGGNASAFNILFNSGIKSLQINWANANTQVVLNPVDQTNDDGLWNVGGTASNLKVDNVNFVSGNGSLSFNLDAGANPSAGYLENTSSQAVNLSDVLNQSTLFLWTYLPTASAFTSVELRWGSSATDYYFQTATVNQQNTAFVNGWNLLAFSWIPTNVVGSPDPSKISYLRVTWNYNGTLQTAVHLDNITSCLGSILMCSYYSKYLFSDPITGTWHQTVQTDSDLINLDTESYPLFLYLCAAFVVQQQSGAESSFDSNEFWTLYQKALLRYTTMYKSQVIKPKTPYYRPPLTSLRRFFNGRGW